MRTYLYWLLSFFVFFTLSACGAPRATQAAPYVDLNHLEPLPTPVEQEIHPLKIAIAAVISPVGTAESYAPLLSYLESELGRPVETEQRRTYAEVNDLVETGQVDLAFVCTSAYIAGRQDFNMQLLVAPVVHGETFYRSQVIVSTESTATSLTDLRGKVFAFTDPMSFTGRVYPTFLLQQSGETSTDFFQRTFFTYSHDDAIRAVANGLADGAAVDSLVLDFAFARDFDLQRKIKIIHTSPNFGIPPVVVNPNIRPQLRAELEAIFLNMHQNPEGLNALNALDIDRFTLVSEALYNLVEEITISCSSEEVLP